MKLLLIAATLELFAAALLPQSAYAQHYRRWDEQQRRVVPVEPILPRPPQRPNWPQYENPNSPRNLCARSPNPADCRFRLEQRLWQQYYFDD